jgi:hypothetical protein
MDDSYGDSGRISIPPNKPNARIIDRKIGKDKQKEKITSFIIGNRLICLGT